MSKPGPIFVSIYLMLIISGLVFSVLMAAAVTLMPPEIGRPFVEEGGPVEALQPVFYFAGAALCFFHLAVNRWRAGLLAGTALMAFGLRELDFQKRFTSISVTRTKFYASGSVPLEAKIIGGLIVLLVLLALFILLKKYYPRFRGALAQREPWAKLLLAAVLLMAAGYFTDGSPRYLRPFGVEVPRGGVFKMALEESFELASSLFFLLAVLARGRGRPLP